MTSMDHVPCHSATSCDMGKEKSYKVLDDECFKGSKNMELNSMNRLLRNQAEKQRRDKLNSYISELASIVPMIAKTSKRLDKTSILRLTAAHLRLHFSCLNPENMKKRRCLLPENLNTDLNMLQQAVGGFLMVATYTGKIVFSSGAIETYLGHQDIDVMGHSVFSFIHKEDIPYVEENLKQLHATTENANAKRCSRKTFYARMRERCQPRSHIATYKTMLLSCSINVRETNRCCAQSQTCERNRKKNCRQDYVCSSLLHMFVQPINLNPLNDMTFLEAFQDAYTTTHGLKGEILYADHRISTITGHLPNEVRGMSAYEYIYDFDVPVAQFAQKLMFSSDNGKGVIVYRLRTRNESFVYLQSSGHLEYNQDSLEVSHFVCINQLLSDEEGIMELKKFQESLMPRVNEIKNITAAEKEDSCQLISQVSSIEDREDNLDETDYSFQCSSDNTDVHLYSHQSFEVPDDTCFTEINSKYSPSLYENFNSSQGNVAYNAQSVRSNSMMQFDGNILGKRRILNNQENLSLDNVHCCEPKPKKICLTFQDCQKRPRHGDRKSNNIQSFMLDKTKEMFSQDFNFAPSKNVAKLSNANIAQNSELDLLFTNLLELSQVQVLSAVCDSISPTCYDFY